MSTSSDVSGDDISQKVSDSKIELFLVCILVPFSGVRSLHCVSRCHMTLNNLE